MKSNAKFLRQVAMFFGFVSGAIAILGCAKKDATASKLNINLLNLAKNTGKSARAETGFNRLDFFFDHALKMPRSVGTNSLSQLTSLQYAFNQIAMCQDVSATSAFGFSAETGCISAYDNPVGDASDETISPGDFATKYGGTKNIFDLMSTTDLTRLSSTQISIPDSSLGSYNYAVLTWVPMIGVAGTVTLADSSTLATTALTASGISSGTLKSNVSTMTGATPALTYVQSANGGMVSKFQAPLSVASGVTYSLDVVFNPAGVLKGCSGSTAGNISDGTNSITMPMLPVTALLVASTDSLMRESYSITVNATFSVRVDLYYLKSDAALNVLAATITDLPTNNDNQCFGGDHRVFRVVTQTNKTLSFYTGSDDGSLIMSGLSRNTVTSNTVTFAPSGYTGLPGGATTGSVTAVTTTQY